MGFIIGSRGAVILGSVPVHELVRSRSPLWEPYGFRACGSRLLMATYVGNLFANAPDLGCAFHILEDAELHLSCPLAPVY